MRSARPSAPAALPSIIATSAPAPHANGHSNGHANGHSNGHVNGHNGHASYAPPAAQPYSPMPRPAEDGMSPVLPPRVSARMYAQQAPKAAWWRSWPLIVIVLAALAIVTAVILMVWPPGKPAAADNAIDTKENKALSPGTGPDRMETNPLPPTQPPPNQPPAKSGDPWGGNGGPNGSIDIPDDPSVPGGPSGGNGKAKLAGRDAVVMEMSFHFCDRAATCLKDDDLKSYCDTAKGLISGFDFQPPTSCAARNKCLSHIDTLDCNGAIGFDMSTLQTLQNKIQDCLVATTSC